MVVLQKLAILAAIMRFTFILLPMLPLFAFAQQDSIPYFANHTDEITALAYSPDAKYIISAGWDEKVIIQKNDSTCQSLQVLADFKGAVNSVAISRDGTKMIAGGQDGVLRKYTLDSAYFDIATVDTSFTLNNAPITKVLYSPGMRTLYSADNQGKFIAYDMAKEKTMPLKGTVAISAATVSIDGMSVFLVAAGSTSINQFDVFGKLINTFDGHTNDITDLLVTLDRKYLISSSKDKTIRVWDIVNAKEEAKLENHTWAVTDIDIDPFSTYLVSCGLDGLVNLYDVKTRTLIRTQEFEGYKFKAVAISPDHSSIVAAGQPTNVSNPAGFFKINTYIKARKIVVPPPYNVVKKVEPKPIKKDKEKQAIPPSSNPTPTPKAEVKKQGELVKKTDQVEIRIEDKR